jgi:hypothetical protein
MSLVYRIWYDDIVFKRISVLCQAENRSFPNNLKLLSHRECTVHNDMFVFLSQSKQEAVLFEIQFLINETKNALFNLHEWTKPEKVRLSSPVRYRSIFHKFCVSTHDCSISSLQIALSISWMVC